MKRNMSSFRMIITVFLILAFVVVSVQTGICIAQGTEAAEDAQEAYKKFLKKNVSSFTPAENDFTTENTENEKTASYF